MIPLQPRSWLLLGLGALMGAGVTTVMHQRAQKIESDMISGNPPLGVLSLESHRQGYSAVRIRLSGSAPGTEPQVQRSYGGSVSDPTTGTIAFAYSPQPTLAFGHVVVARLSLWNGLTKDFIIPNGSFGTLYQDATCRLIYAPTQPTTTWK